MNRPPRLVLDTNVIISAILWGGKPAQLLALAGEGELQLCTSRVMLDELRKTLERPKLAKAVQATGRTAEELVSDYRRLTILKRPASLERPFSRDPDDDHVIATALAARADFLVTGDDDLLELEQVEGVIIRLVADVIQQVG